MIAWAVVRLRSARSPRLWLASAGLFVLGSSLGLYSAFYVEWSPAETLRYIGFPWPYIVLRLEDGRWVDYVGTPVNLLGVLVFAGASQIPVVAISFGLARKSLHA